MSDSAAGDKGEREGGREGEREREREREREKREREGITHRSKGTKQYT